MVAAAAAGSAGASRPLRVALVVVLVDVGTSAADGQWRRVCGSVACSTTAAVASSSMEGMAALARMVAAVGVP